MRHLKGYDLLKVYPGPDNDWSFLKPAPRSLNESSLSIEVPPETVVAARELAASLRGWSDRKHEFEETPALTEPPATLNAFDFACFFDEKAAWSRGEFGEVYEGVLGHLAKEVKEVTEKPSDLEEWVDIVLLAMDGASRHAGAAGSEFVAALAAKQQKNRARRWLKSSEDGVMEHDRSEESEFEDYLVRIQIPSGRFSATHVGHLRAVWNLVLTNLGTEFDLPVAGPTEDDGLQLSWTANGRHVSIDMCPDGEGDWFARNRVTDFFEGGQLSSAGPLPGALVEHLKTVRRSSKGPDSGQKASE